MADFLTSTVLGLVEGLTEFIPVSSTAHLSLVKHFFGFTQSDTFLIAIQLGPILAIMVLYWAKLAQVFSTVGSDPASRRFIISVLIAFVPAALFGASKCLLF